MSQDATGHPEPDDEISSRSLLFLALCVVLGFASHRARPSIRALGPAWSDLTLYAFGTSLIIAVFPTVYSSVLRSATSGDIPRRRAVFMAFISLCLSAGTIGAGTVIAWLVDPDEEPQA